MRRLLLAIAAVLLLPLASHATIRSYTAVSGDAASVTVTLPTGAAIGDLVLAYAADAYGIPTFPAGWTRFDSTSGGPFVWEYGIASKVLLSGDVSTGSVTITFGGGYYYSAALLAFVGDPGTVRESDSSQADVSGVTAITTSSGVVSGDGAIYFGSARCDGANCTGTYGSQSRGCILTTSNDSGRNWMMIGDDVSMPGGAITQDFGWATTPTYVAASIVIVEGAGAGLGLCGPVGVPRIRGPIY